MHVLAGEVVGVFAHVERADEDGAGGFEPLDQGGVARRRRRIAVDLRAGERRQAGDVEQVLDRERHAGERAELLAAGARLVDRLRAAERALLGDRGEGIEQRIALADAGERRLDDALRAGAAGGDGGGDIGGRAMSENRSRAVSSMKHTARVRHRQAAGNPSTKAA